MIMRALIISLLSVGTIAAPPGMAADEPIQPIQAAAPKDPNMVELGKMLFLIHVYRSPDSSPVTPATT